MTNISGGLSPIHPISLYSVASRGEKKTKIYEGGGGGADKSLSRRDGQHPRLGLRFLVIPAHRQRRQRFIFWFVMRGVQQQSRPCYVTCSPSAEVGGAPPLTFSTRAGCAARLRCCPIRQLRKWAVGRACHLIHHLAQLASVM